MGHRKFFKSEEFLKNPGVVALQEEHKKAFGTPINNNGYPDMGHGRYAQFMPYDKWVRFNNAQRAHYNMVEQSAPTLVCLAGAGLFFPKLSASLGFAFSIGRILYAMGYTTNKGADGRVLGVVIAEMATLGLFLSALYGGASATNLVGSVKGLLGM
jgi:hypothetical protein